MDDFPILGISGLSGSGKTTLIEQVLPALRAQGLRVAVAKHHGHGAGLDAPASDSDRLFRGGADVLAWGAAEALQRAHIEGEGGIDACHLR